VYALLRASTVALIPSSRRSRRPINPTYHHSARLHGILGSFARDAILSWRTSIDASVRELRPIRAGRDRHAGCPSRSGGFCLLVSDVFGKRDQIGQNAFGAPFSAAMAVSQLGRLLGRSRNLRCNFHRGAIQAARHGVSTNRFSRLTGISMLSEPDRDMENSVVTPTRDGRRRSRR
jgi:hypothetical protein